MAYSIEWTAQAENDLVEYSEYLEHFSEQKAKKFVNLCFEKIELLQDFPYSGQSVNDNINLRRLLIDKNVAMYYRLQANLIEILAFFDLRQNPEKNPYN